jgi:hypothetical protein
MNQRSVWRRALGSSAFAYSLLACSSVPSNVKEDDRGAGGATGMGGTVNTGGGVSTGGESSPSLEVPDPGADPPELDPEAACGIGTAEATLRPVNMMIMFDRSTSMVSERTIDPATGLNRWETATSALKNFLSHPQTEGLGVALRFFPHDLPAVGCASQVCDIAACATPLVELDRLTAEVAPLDDHETKLFEAIDEALPIVVPRMDGRTPTGAALEGAVEWALNHQAKNPDERTAIMIVTDGEPDGCEERVFYLMQHVARALEAGIGTYFIGIADPTGKGLNRAAMDYLASAGGTERAYYITDGPSATRDLLETLEAVRGRTIECEFPFPEATSAGEVVDPALVNVTYLPASGSEVNFTKVAQAEDCEDSPSWFYDDPAQPARLHLCPKACDLVSADSGARFRILAGCVSQLK